jgi:hypothetical protein
MSQREALRDLDASLVTAFQANGFADEATYTAPAGVATACVVLVDDQVAEYGEDGATVVGYRTLIRIFLREVAAPVRGATVVADGKTYRLDELESRDQSMERWVVTHG